MKKIKGWWFATKDKKLANGDGRKIRIGTTHKVKGEIIPCRHGLHLSRKPLDALEYAPGPIIYKVIGSGVICPHGEPVNKYVCSERTYIAGGIDASNTLWKFARMCALDVIHLWNAPDVVVEYLKTGNEKLRAASRAASWAALRAASRAASGDASGAALRAALRSASRAASWVASGAALRSALRAASRAASGDALRAAQNKRLTRMLNGLLRK